MSLYKKTVVEQIGVVDRDTDIVVTKVCIWQTTSGVVTVWSDNKIIQEQENE